MFLCREGLIRSNENNIVRKRDYMCTQTEHGTEQRDNYDSYDNDTDGIRDLKLKYRT